MLIVLCLIGICLCMAGLNCMMKDPKASRLTGQEIYEERIRQGTIEP